MNWLTWLQASTPALIAAIVAPLLTVHLALPRLRKETLWNTKHETYARVLDALHQMVVVLDHDFGVVESHREVPHDVATEHAEKYRRAKQEVVRAAGLGDFLLGPDAPNRLRCYLTEMEMTSANEWIEEALLKGMDVTNRCLRDITRIAQNELKIGS